MNITLTPIGYVRPTRADPTDDNGDAETTHTELDTTRFTATPLPSPHSFSTTQLPHRFHPPQLATPNPRPVTAHHRQHPTP